MFLHVLFSVLTLFCMSHVESGCFQFNSAPGKWTLCMFPYTSSNLVLCYVSMCFVMFNHPHLFPRSLSVYQTFLKPSVRTWSRRASWKRCHVVKGWVVHLPDGLNTSRNISSVESFTFEVIHNSSLLWFSFFQDWPMTRWSTCQIFWIGWPKMSLWMSEIYGYHICRPCMPSTLGQISAAQLTTAIFSQNVCVPLGIGCSWCCIKNLMLLLWGSPL